MALTSESSHEQSFEAHHDTAPWRIVMPLDGSRAPHGERCIRMETRPVLILASEENLRSGGEFCTGHSGRPAMHMHGVQDRTVKTSDWHHGKYESLYLVF